jgi:hypothetical protein
LGIMHTFKNKMYNLCKACATLALAAAQGLNSLALA